MKFETDDYTVSCADDEATKQAVFDKLVALECTESAFTKTMLFKRGSESL